MQLARTPQLSETSRWGSARPLARGCCAFATLALLLPLSAAAQQETFPPLPARQVGVPPMQPTAAPPPAPLPSAIPAQGAQTAPTRTYMPPPAGAARRANVQYAGGILSIVADNSSLNGILREVARVTGMQVTGGVAEERVYGTYGPSDPASVLSKLISGTGSNMLLKQDAVDAPLELVLTPRTGGASPPSPQVLRGEEDGEDLPPQQIVPGQRVNLYPAPPPMQAQPPGPAAPATQAQPNPPLPAATDPATTDVRSPNGVKTPQEIYDQLMKLQQQKAGAPK